METKFETKESLIVTISHSWPYTSIEYERVPWEEVGDVCERCTKIKYERDGDMFRITKSEDVIKEIHSKSDYSSSYSSSTNTLSDELLSFTDLQKSEYWNIIEERLGKDFRQQKLDRYNKNYIEDNAVKFYCELQHPSRDKYLAFGFDKTSGYCEIYNRKFEYNGDFADMALLTEEEYNELKDKEFIFDLVRKNDCQILGNGYVYKNIYYEDVESIRDEIETESKNGFVKYPQEEND